MDLQVELMAKRMILVDERTFKELWERSPTHTSKSDLNNQLQSELDNSQIPDDVKAKHYKILLAVFSTCDSKYLLLNLPH